MGFLSKLLGIGIGSAVTGVANVVDKFMETPDEKRAAELVMRKLQLEPDKFQTEINKIEAGHKSLFVAGWRPGIGWICVIGLGCHFVFFPVGEWIAALAGNPIIMPQINAGELMTLVLSLLGLGGLRSYEKTRGLTN